MRILTKNEQKVFDDAFNCIMRVASLETDSTHYIKAGDGRLPSAYIDLAHHFGGVEKLRHYFCPIYRTETMDRLIAYCFDMRLQPKVFLFGGILRVESLSIPVFETEYVMEESA